VVTSGLEILINRRQRKKFSGLWLQRDEDVHIEGGGGLQIIKGGYRAADGIFADNAFTLHLIQNAERFGESRHRSQ
jgi:hypothetical protein